MFRNIQSFLENRPSYEDQAQKRQRQLLKNTIQMMTALSGTFVVRLGIADVTRILSDSTDNNDPLKKALTNMNATFNHEDFEDIDIDNSIEKLGELSKESKINAAVFLAFKMEPKKDPSLVGVATAANFISTYDFTTLPKHMIRNDYTTLTPYFNEYYYIDVLCSKAKGTGKILVANVYEYACRKNMKGLIALSYASKKGTQPQSASTFRSLKFDTVIESAQFNPKTTQKMHGIWFAKEKLDFKGFNETLMALCTRTGLTPKTEPHLMWRCPA